MRLTRAGEYAVRCLLYLARQGQGKVVHRREISQEMDIPDQFLGKIAQHLARSGFIEIVQGAKGGYVLRTPPEEITLLEVVESFVGLIYLNDCIMKPDSCPRSLTCSVHRVWDRAQKQLRDTLREATFDKLLKEGSCASPFEESKRKAEINQIF
jgi:Rrf2 family iron-sulfur cluster assembly transcriptional regulator